MARNILKQATELLQSNLPPPQPWSTLVSNLIHLLHLYSNGLSFSIALDHFASQRRLHTSSSVVPLHLVKLVEIFKSPILWHLSLSDGQLIAHFPHSNFTQLNLLRGTTLTIAANLGEPALKSPAHEDALRLAINSSQAPLSDSPDDIKVTAQFAETPSQSSHKLPTSVCFPTNAIIFHLDESTLSSLNLPHPLDKLTLQRVWDERSLNPEAVFAHVVSVNHQESTLCVHDSPLISTSQPSVTVHFSEDRAPIIHAIQPGDGLLLLSPTVYPTGTSFDLYTTDTTVCLSSKLKSDGLKVRHSQPEGASPDRYRTSAKRKRVDDDLSKSSQPVDFDRVLTLSEPESQLPLVVHARLRSVPYELNDDMDHWVIDFGSLKVKFQGHGIQANSFMEGDEIVMTEFRVSPTQPQSRREWVAEEVHNLSTMHAVLFCPFMRANVSGDHVCRSIRETNGYTTMHVRVQVKSLAVTEDRQSLRLTVVDWNGIGGTIIGSHFAESTDARPVWCVEMSEHVLNTLFQTVSQHFLQSATKAKLDEMSVTFQRDIWFMTLTCNGKKWPVAQVRACVSTSC